MKKIIFFVLLCGASVAHADYEGGDFKISSMRIGPNGVYLAFSPAPAECAGGTHYRMHALVAPTEANYESLVSGLLTAYAAGKTINWIWFSNSGPCSSSVVLQLTQYEFDPE